MLNLYMRKLATTLLLSLCLVTSFGQSLLFNEVMTINTYYKAEDRWAYPWTEFINLSDSTVDLSDYYISQDTTLQDKYRLPSIKIKPGDVQNIMYSGLPSVGSADPVVDPEKDVILLLDSTGRILDRVDLSFMVKDQSYGRRQGFPDQWIYFIEEAFVSPGYQNPDPGPWLKVRNHAEFPIGDCGYHGTLVYDNKMWILDYETLDEQGYWHNLVQVWNSENGRDWTLVNELAPFRHGASVEVFNGYMWAFDFDGKAFRSNDGANWELMSDNIPIGERVVTFNDTLWMLSGNSILKSPDGVTWIIARARQPWEYREEPAFLTHSGKLWMFGGSLYYNTGNDKYFTDVWSSSDGVNWKLETEDAKWEGTKWFSYRSHNNRLWMIAGGWNYYDKLGPTNGNHNEVWTSVDGAHWEQVQFPSIWYNRHAAMTWVYKNEIWFACGYSGSLAHMYNDVWRYSLVPQSIEAMPTAGHEASPSIDLDYGEITRRRFRSSLNRDLTFTMADTNVATITDSLIIAVNAGQTTLTITQAGSEMVLAAEKVVPVIVHKRNLLAQATDVKTEFGEEVLSVPIKYRGFVTNESEENLEEEPTVKELPKVTAAVGRYELMPEGGVARNYNFVYQPGSLEITPSSTRILTYPNPTTDQVNVAIDTNLKGPVALTLYDVTGSIVMRREFEQFQLATLETSYLNPGVYVVSITGNGFKQVRKIIKL
jgi:hypothetical protein